MAVTDGDEEPGYYEAMITFAYDRATRVRTATYTGVVTDPEFLSSYAALTSEPDYDAGADDLVDLRPVERFEVTAEAMRHLIDLFQPVDALGVPTRLAIVAASDFTYGMSRMYSMLRGDNVPEEVQVFRSMEEAREWLERSRRTRGSS